MPQNATRVKTHTSTGRPVAWFTLRIKWHSWAENTKVSNPFTVRGDFRFNQEQRNITNMLKDLLNYLDDYHGQIEKAVLYDNRRTYPANEILIYKNYQIRVNHLPDFVQEYADPIIKAITAKPPKKNG